MASKLSRAVQYFREADLDEATVAFELISKVLAQRSNPEKPRQKRKGRGPAKPKVNSSFVTDGAKVFESHDEEAEA